MKIDYLRIRSRFKNLEDVLVDFDENHLMTVVVGSNGSGKSNILEALVSIFRNLDLGESPLFSYKVKYRLGTDDEHEWVIVDADPDLGGTPDKQYSITHEKSGASKSLRISQVKRAKSGEAPYLPNNIFAYYSGPSDRLENYFRKHRTDFYRRLLKNEVDLDGDIRPLFYAKPIHSQFVLLAFFLSDGERTAQDFLLRHLGIESLDSVHFVMRKPGWSRPKNKDEIFWGADGVVREFLETLFPHVLAPLKLSRTEDTTLTGSSVKNEFLHLFVPDLAGLRKFAEGMSPDVFFKMLESTLLSEIISEVSIRVKTKWSDEPLSFSELSEGEQQLLTVLGLLKFTGGRDTLFLLDEPDTHLNPAWATKYLSFLKHFTPHHDTSHLLMVTHHPLAIAELEKGQVQVLKMVEIEGAYKVEASPPEKSPRGMGYSGILMSDMFGLKSDVDQHTLKKMHRRAALAAQDEITELEEWELDSLNRELESLGYASTDSDPYFRDYLKRYEIEEVQAEAEDNEST